MNPQPGPSGARTGSGGGVAGLRGVLRRLGRGAANLASLLLAGLLAALPRRWWAGLDRRLGLQPERVALPSSFLHLVSFFALGALNYMPWLRSFVDPLQGPLDSDTDMMSFALLWMNPLTPVIYCFVTPVGFVALIGTVGGLYRTIHAWAMSDCVADPTLSLIEKLLVAVSRRRHAKARERSKGTRTRDRLEHADADGDSAWDLRLTTPDELGWPVGSTVRVLGELYQVLAVLEGRDSSGRLRLAYELRHLEGAEILRGLREYRPAQPPQVIGQPRLRRAAPAQAAPVSIPLSPDDRRRP